MRRQIAYVRSRGPIQGPKFALVIGSSMGYGLASRICASFGAGANTVGVAFEKEPTETKNGTAGWYTTKAFDEEASWAGLKSRSINGDAFSDAIKEKAIEEIKHLGGKVDLVVYSLASPVRVDPVDGVMYRSALKPIAAPYSSRTVDIMSGEVREVTFEPATEEEISNTRKVMGGEDWKRWISFLEDAHVLADGATTVAYSYIGPEVTRSIYRSGTIGKAKEDLERTAHELTEALARKGGQAFVSINKALVTRASAVIPGVSLYLVLLYKVMKAKGTHEGCIEQIERLFTDRLYAAGGKVPVDAEGRIRIDDLEMVRETQDLVADLWDKVNASNLPLIGDMEGVRKDFLNIHGFAVDGVDYSRE